MLAAIVLVILLAAALAVGVASAFKPVLTVLVFVGIGAALIATLGWGVATIRFWKSLDVGPQSKHSGTASGMSRRQKASAYVISFGLAAIAGAAYFGLPHQRDWLWRIFVIASFVGLVWLGRRQRRKVGSGRSTKR